MIQFARPEALVLLLALPLWLLLRGGRRGAPGLRYSSTRLAGVAARSVRARWVGLLPFLRVPAVAALILALAEPELGHAETRVHARGIDIVLALDVSASMEAADMSAHGPSSTRLEVAREVVAQFIEARPNDRIGVVAFAGEPYLVSPLTLDHAWLITQVRGLATGLIEDGTAIGAALATSVERLARDAGPSRVVVLLSDGASNAGAIRPSLAAEAARALGVKVYTVGLGTAERARIPLRRPDGRTRWTWADVAVDEVTLQRVAEVTGGRFFRAHDAESLAAVYAEIDAMERTERVLERVDWREPRTAPFVLAGLGLLGLELLSTLALARRLP